MTQFKSKLGRLQFIKKNLPKKRTVIDDTILVFHFYLQFLVNYIDEHNLFNHGFIKHSIKVGLNLLYKAIEEQLNRMIKGDKDFPVCEIDNDALDAHQFGTMTINEYFTIMFAVGDMEKDRQRKFMGEYNELMSKYEIKINS